jgi:predicted phage-related endonuclease
MSVHRTPITSREAWLAKRAENIGASEIAALFGCHPYRTALQLYAEKTGVARTAPASAVLERGHILEPAVAEMARRERPDWRIEKASDYLSAPEWRLGCTPDFWVDCPRRGPGVLQCKTVAKPVYDETWADGPPLWVLLQTLQEQMLAGVAWGAVGVLITSTYTVAGALHDFARHEATEARIIAAARAFWSDLEAGRPPQPDFDRDGETIRALHPQDNGAILDLSGDNRLPELLAQYETYAAMGRRAEKELKRVKAEIAAKLGDAAGAVLPGWRIAFPTRQRAGYEVKPTRYRELRVTRQAETEQAA